MHPLQRFNKHLSLTALLTAVLLLSGFAYKNVDESFFKKTPSTTRCTAEVLCPEAPQAPTLTVAVQDTQLHSFKKTVPEKIKLSTPKTSASQSAEPDTVLTIVDAHSNMTEKSEWWVKRLLYDVKDIAESLSIDNFLAQEEGEDELVVEESDELNSDLPTPATIAAYQPDKRIVDGLLYINGVLASDEEHSLIGLKTPTQVAADALIASEIALAATAPVQEPTYRATASRYSSKGKNTKKATIPAADEGYIELNMPLTDNAEANDVIAPAPPPPYRTGGSPAASADASVLLANVYAEDIPCNGHYDYNWNTSNIHPYRYNVSQMPGKVEFFLSHGLGDDFTLPVGGLVTSGFGPRWGRYHNGVDLDLNTGDHVKAAFEGMVRIAQYSSSYGYVVVIRHFSGLETTYAHLSKIYVSPNQKVKAGDVIALGGNTGRSTGSHLHFEVRYKGLPIDPTTMIDFANGRLKTHTLVVDKYFFSSSSPYEDAHDNSYAQGRSSSHRHSHSHSATASGSKKYHTVKKGDTLSEIADRYGKSVRDLYRLNRLTGSSKLSIGQKIRVK